MRQDFRDDAAVWANQHKGGIECCDVCVGSGCSTFQIHYTTISQVANIASNHAIIEMLYMSELLFLRLYRIIHDHFNLVFIEQLPSVEASGNGHFQSGAQGTEMCIRKRRK